MDSKKPIRIRLLSEGLMIIFITITPILFYSYKYTTPDTEILDFFFFEIPRNGWDDARTNYWYIMSKFVPLSLLALWFVTSKQWWYHAILIPISMYAFQLIQAFRDSETYDESELFYIIGVTMIVTPIVYFIRVKLVDKYIHGIDLKAMDEELKLLKEKERLEEELEKLRRKKETLSKKM